MLVILKQLTFLLLTLQGLLSQLHIVQQNQSPILGAISPLQETNLLTASPEPKGSLIEQRIDNDGWYVKFSTGEEIYISNSFFKNNYFFSDLSDPQQSIRDKLKYKYNSKIIDWNKVNFYFYPDGRIKDIEWIQ